MASLPKINMKMKRHPIFGQLLFLSVLIILINGCKKDEGPGGTSTIRGKIIVHDFDAAFQNHTPVIYPAVDAKTYIIYGTNHTTYDANYSTSYDGTYEFKYLQKGSYRMFAYSKDSTGASIGRPLGPKIPVFVDVEITKNGSTVDAPDIIILNNNQ